MIQRAEGQVHFTFHILPFKSLSTENIAQQSFTQNYHLAQVQASQAGSSRRGNAVHSLRRCNSCWSDSAL